MRLRAAVRAGFQRLGYDITKLAYAEPEFPLDFDDQSKATIRAVREFTMTPDARIFALCESVRHVVRTDLPGAIVECGVWRGGSMMAAARTLVDERNTGRDLFLFDTFEGMSPPTESDTRHDGVGAAALLADGDSEYWCRAGLPDVRRNIASTGYPAERTHFVMGRVEETIPENAPAEIALLRLDTDWYESTLHELEHLYPRVVPGGIVIIDDYGYWRGARQATDEFLARLPERVYLHRVDYSGRVLVKP